MSKYHENQPLLSETVVRRVRQTARRYVLAGGGIFPTPDGDDRDERIANVARVIDVKRATQAEGWADTIEDLDHEQHERIWEAATHAIATANEAAFLFGAVVGLETAALACRSATHTRRARAQGGL